ncbi:MAG: chitobiase/beta-hexosaminidase C-terminal domain-containing protein, partial [Verrucomicrobiota bacterium]
AGNVYVADTDNHTIRKVTPVGVVTTLAGLARSSGSADGTGSAARFYGPRGVAVDSAGNVYVVDTDNHTIRKVTPAGVVTTLAGLAGSQGSADGTGSAARFPGPDGVAVDRAGNVYVADAGNNRILKGVLARPPVMPGILLNGQFYANNVVVVTNAASFQVQIQTSFTNGTIFYTVDGSDPTAGGTYTGPFTIAAPFSIRAVAFSEDFSQAGVSEAVNSLSATTPGGGIISVMADRDLSTGNMQATVTASANTGWSFLNWLGDTSSSDTSVTLTMDGGRSVQAIFGTALTTNVLTGGGYILLQPENGPYPFGAIVRLSAVPLAGKYFVRWGGAAGIVTISPIRFTITNSNPAFSATFASLSGTSRSLTLLVNGAGNVTRTPALSFYTNGATVALTAIPDPGSFFTGWSNDVSGTLNPLALVMNTNKLVTAQFRLSSEQPPAIEQQPVGGTFLAGTNVTLEVTATGAAPLTYQWRKDGANISGANGGSLTLTNVHFGNAGSYGVVVSNSVGSVTSSVAVVTVALPIRTRPTVQGAVVAWGAGGPGQVDGYPHFGQTTLPSGLSGVVAIAAGDSHSLALKSDGTVVAWGANDAGQTTVPSGLNGVVAIAAGHRHNLALKSDGTVVALGINDYGRTTVPSGLSGVVAIAGGYAHSLALKSDGTVVACSNSHFDIADASGR